MTSKECLERLFSIPKDCDHCPCDAECNFPNASCNKLYETIKQDLDRLEKLEKENEKLKCKNHDLLEKNLDLVLNNHNQSMGVMELMKAIFVFKKVIKILKDKNVDIYELLESKNVVEYNNLTWSRYDFGGDELTEEEYSLSKEVLENVKEN